MGTEGKTRTITETIDAQGDLRPLPPRIEREETEAEALIRRTTVDAIEHTERLTEDDVKRIMAARARLIETMRSVALKMTKPQHWVVFRDREGRIVGHPKSAACLVFQQWGGVRVFNHRSLTGEPEAPTVTTEPQEGGATITILEMLCDAQFGKMVVPGIYSAVRSDDEFIGRARSDHKGGPRLQDLRSTLRTNIDAKAVRVAMGITKVAEEELIAAGIDLTRCDKGAGYGTSSDRAAGKVADAGVPEMAKALWDEILKRTGGNVGEAKTVLVDITKRAPDPKKKDDKGFRGFDSHERFTLAWQVENAAKALKNHEVFGDKPQGD